MAEHDAEFIAQVRRGFEALPDLPRKVFYLHRVERLDYVAIGERLGITVHKVEAQLADAILLIAQFIDREDEAERRRG